MKTYFVAFRVIPTLSNLYSEQIDGAIISCWIKDDSMESAVGKAKFQIHKFDWQIVGIEFPPHEVLRIHFAGKDLGEENFDKAQIDGFAINILAWSKDGKTTLGPITQKMSSENIDLEEYNKIRKKLSGSGRCLHFEAGARCGKIIKAHSIQKSKSLEGIANEGHVYVCSTNFSDLRKNMGRISYKREGINNVSTFLGFCSKHDKEIFKPIDDYPFIPTHEQVCLLAYRSLCREVFVKENTYNLWKKYAEKETLQNAIKGAFANLRDSTEFGFNQLLRIKSFFEDSIKSNNFSNIKYVVFVSSQKPFISFSGLLYPDYDFLGNPLQDLANQHSVLKLITFCSATMVNNNWGYVFAWHNESSDVCIPFIQSLATQIHGKKKIDDFLFRLIIAGSENHAISPEWWDGLSEKVKEEISIKATQTVGIFNSISPSYLMEGLEGIADWHFERVISHTE